MKENRKETTAVSILATSDLHGHLFPWNYIEEKENPDGSLLQIASAVKELYDPESMILADAGDLIQDLQAERFPEDEVHPMMGVLNDLGYEIWTAGNHEFDFGMESLMRLFHEFQGTAVLGNVYDETGERIAKPYVILEKKGVRIAVLSMVTPNISQWSAFYLKGYTVTNPIDETRKLLKELEGKYDVLLGVHHMGIHDELDTEGSGMESYLKYFPEFDAVIASHEHKLAQETINGVLVAENAGNAKSLIQLTLDLEKTEEGWKVTGRSSRAFLMREYASDAALTKKYMFCHERALNNMSRVIGTVLGEEPLGGENPLEFFPPATYGSTALMTLLNRVVQHYTHTKVSCIALSKYRTNLNPGPVTVSEAAWLFPYPNTLNRLRMTGRQLRRYIEYNVQHYNTYQEGDLTVSFDAEYDIYSFDIFSGVNFEVNIAKEPFHRVENLTWPDGTPVREEDEFEFGIGSFRYACALSRFGQALREEDGLPILLEENVSSDVGYLPYMIIRYIEQVLKGVVPAENENNWKLTGIRWEEALHEKAMDFLEKGVIPMSAVNTSDGDNRRSLRIEDLRMAEKRISEKDAGK